MCRGAGYRAKSPQAAEGKSRAAYLGGDDVPQAALQRHLGGTLPCRFEPIFKVLDSDSVLDLRLVDGHHDARGAAIGIFGPLVLAENAER
jgi:hypothetical protein